MPFPEQRPRRLRVNENIRRMVRENSLSVTDMRSRRPESPETSRLPKEMPIAMAYVPFQQWGDVHSSEDALESGTLFPDLVFPFGKGGGR